MNFLASLAIESAGKLFPAVWVYEFRRADGYRAIVTRIGFGKYALLPYVDRIPWRVIETRLVLAYGERLTTRRAAPSW